MESPGTSVVIAYPGASSEDIEAQVIRPLETDLNSIEGIVSMESTARPNMAMFVLRFEQGTNMDTTVERIRGHILNKRGDLPAEVRDPEVNKFTTAYTAQMVLAVAGHRSEAVLTRTAEQLEDEILTLPGVASVKLRGDRRPAMRIRFDPGRLARHGLTTDLVVARLRQDHVRIPAGDIRAGKVLARLEVGHEPKTTEDIAKLPVGAARGSDGIARTIQLGDVAEVQDESLRMRERFLHDAVPAVGIEVRFRNDANGTALGKSIRALITDRSARLDAGVQVRVAYDQPEWVDYALRNFTNSLLEGILLVMGVVTLGLGLRSSVAVAVAIPLAIGGALVGLFIVGFALDQISIAALIVALGLLVDDAVVVIDCRVAPRDCPSGPSPEPY